MGYGAGPGAFEEEAACDAVALEFDQGGFTRGFTRGCTCEACHLHNGLVCEGPDGLGPRFSKLVRPLERHPLDEAFIRAVLDNYATQLVAAAATSTVMVRFAPRVPSTTAVTAGVTRTSAVARCTVTLVTLGDRAISPA